MSKRVKIATHILVLGWFNLVMGAILLLVGFVGFFFFAGIGAASDDAEALPILFVVGCSALGLLLVFSIPGFIAGYALLARLPWGRLAGIIVSILHLFNIPIGTAFGIYGLWVLTEPEAEAYFASPREEG